MPLPEDEARQLPNKGDIYDHFILGLVQVMAGNAQLDHSGGMDVQAVVYVVLDSGKVVTTTMNRWFQKVTNPIKYEDGSVGSEVVPRFRFVRSGDSRVA